MIETQSPQTPATPDKRRVRPALLIGAGAVIGAVVAVAAVVLATTGIHFGSEKTGPSLRSVAIQKCEAAVRAQLKAPSTAKFSGVDNDPDAVPDDKVSASWHEFDLIGYVDSQNSFGAMIRNVWTCSVAYSADTTAADSPGEWQPATATVTSE